MKRRDTLYLKYLGSRLGEGEASDSQHCAQPRAARLGGTAGNGREPRGTAGNGREPPPLSRGGAGGGCAVPGN